MTKSYDDAGISGAQRLEIFTGAGKRRDWPPEVKVSIVAESYSGQESISAVARRHAMYPSQLFTWRRELCKQMQAQGPALPATPAGPPLFVPAVLEPSLPSDAGPVSRRPRRRRRSSPAAVELEIDGVAVRIARGADKRLIAAVIQALKATR
ncbi:transposase [Novosphingobium chloroacetimidivorans]|uniref:Transposase n=1 Tax=Novosphingobium chloroacetimidivorans TaxID=1428314 RepID=A0A7W7KDV0_9SPHN|nr:transposase [Novosphingobium chloroacetimidivorans]MBB4861029.1 transposase [Novosphingobium chloroacetimidivorans]